MKCRVVLQSSDGLSNKVSNIIRRLMDNMKCSSVVLQCSGGLSNKVSNIIRSLMDNMKCSSVVLQCSDGLSNKVSNIIRRLIDNMKLLFIQGPAKIPIWQYSCEWNCWCGELILERFSSKTQGISVATERWSVEHRVLAVEMIFKNKDSVLTQKIFHRHFNVHWNGCPWSQYFFL